MATPKFSKFARPEAGRPGQITDRDLDIIEAVLRYRFCSAAQIVRLAGGNEDVTHRRLRRLWECGLVTRWAFPGFRTHSEFYYYWTTASRSTCWPSGASLRSIRKCLKKFAATAKRTMPVRPFVVSTCNSAS